MLPFLGQPAVFYGACYAERAIITSRPSLHPLLRYSLFPHLFIVILSAAIFMREEGKSPLLMHIFASDTPRVLWDS